MTSKRMTLALAAALMVQAAGVSAHGEAAHTTPRSTTPSVVEMEFGRTGNPSQVKRTITVSMADTMRFSPARLQVKRGDTVRIVVRNDGKALHEFVLGTMAQLKAHAEMMREHPGMEHDEPYMAHVAPGRRATVVWQFTQPGEFFYGCLIPGHFEAGMVGKVTVR
jgi:uncharacterized cupredoxin-like copper-binding protein